MPVQECGRIFINSFLVISSLLQKQFEKYVLNRWFIIVADTSEIKNCLRNENERTYSDWVKLISLRLTYVSSFVY